MSKFKNIPQQKPFEQKHYFRDPINMSETLSSILNFKIPLKKSDNEKSDDSGSEEIFMSPLAAINDDKPVIKTENFAPIDNYRQKPKPSSTEPVLPKMSFYKSSESASPTKTPPEGTYSNYKESLKRPAFSFYYMEDGVPEELKQLLKPLECDLCKVKSNSVISARAHYESKNHEKKVNTWMSVNMKDCTGPVTKKPCVGPNSYHCDVCDLALTSTQHASLHYNGRKHRNAAAGRSKPSGSGFFKNGAWMRSTTPASDPSGRFGIGSNFTSPEMTDGDNLASDNKTIAIDSNRYCSICEIHASSEQHLKEHFAGSKHAKKLKALKSPPYVPEPSSILSSVAGSEKPPSNIPSPPKIDMSIYRTPSGNFYCKTCNVTVTHENAFAQHLISKKHIRQYDLEKKNKLTVK